MSMGMESAPVALAGVGNGAADHCSELILLKEGEIKQCGFMKKSCNIRCVSANAMFVWRVI
ncbi:hypothetical protein GCM10010912_67850 [Paenibacillus albidus]|uniref:Uncharacterized protein n=1 Tax=Paenibacillus albidus TaxID=2041023 RepID=A0A917LCK9_9BACL|nr:hypothetical protein GCM10010912_67850 [Paenibacillus albidus]